MFDRLRLWSTSLALLLVMAAPGGARQRALCAEKAR